MWNQLFGVGDDLTTLQLCARAVVVFAFGLLLVRLGRRRAFSKWTALDIILSIIAGSNLSRALTGNAPLGGTLIATALLVGLHFLLAQIVARSRLFSRLLENAPADLALDGELVRGATRRHAVSEADLNEALRSAGVENVAATRRITLEPSGSISVITRS
jgi:uncharacterized membrane protein YcaP (DUF421 family)